MLSLLPVTLLIASVSCFPFSKINYFVNTCTSHIEQELNISQGTAPDLKEPYSFGYVYSLNLESERLTPDLELYHQSEYAQDRLPNKALMILRELKYEDEENRLTLSGRLSTYNAERLGRINMVGETASLRFGTYSSEKNQWYKYITSGTEGGISARITSIRLTTKKLDNGETYKDMVLIVNPVDTGKNEYLNWQHGGTRQMIWSGPDKKRCGLSKRSFNEIIDSAVLL